MTFALVLLRTFSQLTLEKSQVMLEICEHCLRTFSRVVQHLYAWSYAETVARVAGHTARWAWTATSVGAYSPATCATSPLGRCAGRQ